MLILPPAGPPQSRLLGELWEATLGATEIGDVTATLTRLGLDQLPSLGVLFRTSDGLRAMVRGGVDVHDGASEELLVSGAGGQAWSEVTVDAPRLRVRLEPPTADPALLLPILEGAAQISTLNLVLQALADADPAGEPPGDPTEGLATADVPIPPAEENVHVDGALAAASCAPAVQPAFEEDIELFALDPDEEDSDEKADSAAGSNTQRLRAVPRVVAVLRTAGQDPVPVERSVLIGRAPHAESGSADQAATLTVHSPSCDVSRSHVEVSIVDGKLQATDLHSTNGTTLIRHDPALGSERLPAGEAVSVELGDVLDLGDGVTIAIDAPA